MELARHPSRCIVLLQHRHLSYWSPMDGRDPCTLEQYPGGGKDSRGSISRHLQAAARGFCLSIRVVEGLDLEPTHCEASSYGPRKGILTQSLHGPSAQV